MIVEKLDKILHSQIRLAIMSMLISIDSAQFNYLKEKTGATPGNLSFQLKKLEKAKYIRVKKSFKNNYPLTTVRITSQGTKAFGDYVNTMKKYLNL